MQSHVNGALILAGLNNEGIDEKKKERGVCGLIRQRINYKEKFLSFKDLMITAATENVQRKFFLRFFVYV